MDPNQRFTGAYDEMAILPGYFHVPGTGKDHIRITRIYVSQKETTFNGIFRLPKSVSVARRLP